LYTLAYIGVQAKLATQYAIDQEGDTEGFNVQKMAVFVPAPDDGMLRNSSQYVFRQGARGLQQVAWRDYLIDGLVQQFVVAITEQFAKSQIAEFDLLIPIFRHNADWAGLDKGVKIGGLLAKLPLGPTPLGNVLIQHEGTADLSLA